MVTSGEVRSKKFGRAKLWDEPPARFQKERNLYPMGRIGHAVSRSQDQNHTSQNRRNRALPYDALNARCSMCRAVPGRRCASSRGKAIRYPHRQRTEAAAAEYRSAVRLQILDRTRRHPFSLAFSVKRMAVEGFSERKGGKCVGGHGRFSRPGLEDA